MTEPGSIRVLNVNSFIDLESGGGGAERTFQMSRSLARRGLQCTVLTLKMGASAERIAAIAPARVVALESFWPRFHVPRIRRRVIRRLVEESDIIHLTAHWSVLNALVYRAARHARKPYVVCPLGTLPLFGRSSRLKRLYNRVVGTAMIRNASAWIAATPAEFPHFESYGVAAQRVTVIPNGSSAEDFPPVDTAAFRRRHGLPDSPLILFMGRLNSIKGPDLLLQAFILAADRLPHHHLAFAGPDEGLLPQLTALVERAGVRERVHFLGYLHSTDKSAAYRSADVLAVPSRQDAMPFAALEAGVCGTPALLTDQCGFGDLRSLDPHLVVPANPEGIAEGLVRLLSKREIRGAAALAWRDFVSRQYTWDAISPQYVELYRRLVALK